VCQIYDFVNRGQGIGRVLTTGLYPRRFFSVGADSLKKNDIDFKVLV